MSKLIYTFPILAALGMATPVFAQDTDADEPAADTAANGGGEAVETLQGQGAFTDLDMGNEVLDDPTYTQAVHEDWELKCFRSEAEQDPCQMYQLLFEEGGNPVAEFSIFRLPGQSQAMAGATIIVPLGTLLTEDIKISVDGGRAKSYSYRFCNMVGCYAQIGLTEDDVNAFRRGMEAQIQIVPAQAPDQVVNIPVSLRGFTAAFEETSVLDD